MPPRHRVRMVPLEQARWQLGILWFVGAGLVFAILIVQSLTGVYEARTEGVWGWALPNFLPTLSLMIAVFKGTALEEETETDLMRVRRPFFRLTLFLSAFHLLAVAAVILIHPFSGSLVGPTDNPMVFIDMSNLWLGPSQAVVAGVIGTLFFSRKGIDEKLQPNASGVEERRNDPVA